MEDPDVERTHTPTCRWCGRSDDTVSETVTRGGQPWPPLCSSCAAAVRAQGDRAKRRQPEAVPA